MPLELRFLRIAEGMVLALSLLLAGPSAPGYAQENAVSLSASTILVLLRDEPGLMLQAKKALARAAYEQGRLLEPSDLTDEAVFDLIRSDAEVRALLTREIEDRHYIQAKPRREELEQGQVLALHPPKEGAPIADAKTSRTQEDTYWAAHERTLEYRTAEGDDEGSGGAGDEVHAEQRRRDKDVREEDRRCTDFAGYGGKKEMGGGEERVSGATAAAPPSGADGSLLPGARTNEANAFEASLERTSVAAAERSLDLPPYRPSDRPSDGRLYGTLLDGMRVPEAHHEHIDIDGEEPGKMAARTSPAKPARKSSEAATVALEHRPNPFASIPSLYDLYAQYPTASAALERFGAGVFRDGTGNFDELPMDMPAGPEYVLGPGDGVNIELFGGVSERLQRVVDRSGRIALPEAGMIEVSGHSLGEAQRVVQAALRTQYRDVEADVSLARLRTVRVYVVGDVERPGAYDVSALSTPLNALYQAGGPTERGSLRTLRHYRGQQLVEETDVYDLLLHGVRRNMAGLQPGDTILVPPLGAEVTVEGMVRRPARYELRGERNLAEVLELAGGVLPSGTLRHIDVERVVAHQSRTMLGLDIAEDGNEAAVGTALENFVIEDGDRMRISPILPYADKAVYLTGHVVRPGKFAYREGMVLTDIVKSYSDLMPEPYRRHAEIVRLNPPDFTPSVMAFNLGDALGSGGQAMALKPFDTIRIFGRFDVEDPPTVAVSGEVRDPGSYITNGATHLRDAVYLAGGTTRDAQLGDAQIFRRETNGSLAVLNVNLDKALAGSEADNVLLAPKDHIFIHKNPARSDPQAVKIEGEVARPGKYPLGDGMTAAQLVRLAGGLKRGAYTETADLTRFEVERGTDVIGEHLSVPIARALAGENGADVRLHDGDVLNVRQIAGWNDLGATITVKGEVEHPGGYGIQQGERLSSILARAGGFREDAYPYGAILERTQVRELEQKSRAQLLTELEAEGTVLKGVPSADGDDKAVKEASILQWKTTVENLQTTPPSGRLVIHISKDLKRWANTANDIEVRAGDTIYIPKRPGVVIVDGAVYNATAVAYKPGRSAEWYLRQAGGPSNSANKKAIFVVRADGSVIGGTGGMFSGGVEHAELFAGDTVVVPEKAFSGTTRWKTAFQVSQVLQAAAIAASLGHTF